MDSEKSVVIVADHLPVVIEGVRAILGRAPDLEFAGAGTSKRAIREMVRREGCSVLLVDKNFGPGAVTELLEEIRATGNRSSIAVWGSPMTEAEAVRLCRAGAQGVLHKSSSPSDLITCLRHISNGKCYVDPALFSVHAPGPLRRATLSKRELEVLECVTCGGTNNEIASRLGITVGTLKVHIRRIGVKTGIHGRYALWLAAAEERPDGDRMKAQVARSDA